MALDRRVRLRPKSGAESYVYGDIGSNGLLSILRQTDGMIWPSTPSINVTQAANYDESKITHSIAAYNNFESTQNTTITISGDFHVGNAQEAYYLMACIHFLRTLTKMDFGRTSPTRGTAPPVLILSAYGKYQFNDIPVIVKGTNFEYRDDVDYLEVPIDASAGEGFPGELTDKSVYYETFHKKEDKVWVPQVMNINVTLEQQPTGDYISKEFNLNEFKRGTLLLKSGGFI